MTSGYAASGAVTDRVWTVPNLLTTLRLVGVPLFLWLIVRNEDGAALLVLALSGATDYLDGQIARRTGAVTRLGQVLDPVADRLFILSTLLGLVVREVLPWWFAALLLLRDAAGAVLVARVRRAGYRGLPVHFVGKAATFMLLYAFPLLLLAQWQPGAAHVVLPIAWACAWWGALLYWAGFVLYVVQVRVLLHDSTGPGRRTGPHDQRGLPGSRCTAGGPPLGS